MSYAPVSGATGVAVGTAIVLTFNEAVLAGSGVVVLQSTSGGVSKTLAIADATQVTVSGTTVTLQPTGWLSTGLSTASYTVVLASGVVTDASAARNAFAGLTAGTFTFTTVDDAAPVLVSTVPAHGAVDVALTSTLVLTFNEPVQMGAGNVVLTASAGSPAVTIAAGAATASGSTVTLTLAPHLASALNGQSYSVAMPSGFVKDLNNVAFAGISAGALVFAVVDTVAPAVVSYRPANESTGVAANSDVILEFDSAVARARATWCCRRWTTRRWR